MNETNQDTTPHRDPVPNFDPKRVFNWQDHDWRQHGRQLVCYTCPNNYRHGTVITSGLMLVGSRGNWSLVPEGGTPNPTYKPPGKRSAKADVAKVLLATED